MAAKVVCVSTDCHPLQKLLNRHWQSLRQPLVHNNLVFHQACQTRGFLAKVDGTGYQHCHADDLTRALSPCHTVEGAESIWLPNV